MIVVNRQGVINLINHVTQVHIGRIYSPEAEAHTPSIQILRKPEMAWAIDTFARCITTNDTHWLSLLVEEVQTIDARIARDTRITWEDEIRVYAKQTSRQTALLVYLVHMAVNNKHITL